MNNDRPPVCSPGIGEDRKQVFKLQWPYSCTTKSVIVIFLVLIWPNYAHAVTAHPNLYKKRTVITKLCIFDAIIQETVTLSKRLKVLKAIESMASLLTESIAWAEKAPSQRELFCLDFISSYLDTIKVITESFEWICHCENDAVDSILNIYGNFLEISKCQPSMKEIPDSIRDNESQSVKNLFKWILKIRDFLSTWRDRFNEDMVNYDQINEYKEHLSVLQKMSICMKVEHLVCSDQEVKEVKQHYEREFKELNSLLLKPIPGDGQRKT